VGVVLGPGVFVIVGVWLAVGVGLGGWVSLGCRVAVDVSIGSPVGVSTAVFIAGAVGAEVGLDRLQAAVMKISARRVIKIFLIVSFYNLFSAFQLNRKFWISAPRTY
jgi:hypothetical protein